MRFNWLMKKVLNQLVAIYIARSDRSILMITLIYLLPFDKNLKEPLLYPILLSSTGDNLVILILVIFQTGGHEKLEA